MTKKDEFIKIFALSIRTILNRVKVSFDDIQEIRMRVNRPLMIACGGSEYFVTGAGELKKDVHAGYQVSRNELNETMEYIANYSMYAFEEEMKQGYITIQGGHRVGIAGKTILDGDKIRNVKYISFINVRMSHQIMGCADKVLPYIIKDREVCHTLLISPPRSGKTTLLRDIIRQISNGNTYCSGKTVGVVDERSEIGGAYLGVPQNDLGIRTDLLDCCPKAAGMMMLVRSMSPGVIAVDEIGDYDDIHAIEAVINCGCKLIATVHGSSMEDMKRKPLLQKLVTEKVFKRYVILHNQEGIGQVRGIYDERGSNILENGGI